MKSITSKISIIILSLMSCACSFTEDKPATTPGKVYGPGDGLGEHPHIRLRETGAQRTELNTKPQTTPPV